MLQELLETERSFLTVLEIVSQDFYLALKDVLTPDDLELLFAIARVGYGASPVLSALRALPHNPESVPSAQVSVGRV